MWWQLQYALDIALLLVSPWGAVVAIKEAIRSRTSSRNARPHVFIAGSLGVILSYALFIWSALVTGVLGFFAAYPPRIFVIINVFLCGLGLFAALLGAGRFRLALSISSVCVLYLWAWDMTPLKWKIASLISGHKF
jgi:hypothetical protein